jgi:hypothetical protein
MTRRPSKSKYNLRLYIGVISLLVGTILFGLVGAEAMTTSDLTRTTEVKLVQTDADNAIVHISPATSIYANTTNQELATITNHQQSMVDYTITLPPDVANYVSFRSTLSTSVTPDGDTVSVTLDSGETAVLFVDVDPSATHNLDTAAFRVAGDSSGGGPTLSVTNDGPNVVTA